MSKKEDIKVETKVEPSKAIVENKPKTLINWLNDDSVKSAIQQALPKHLTAERYVRIAIQAITRIPKLKECEPKSVIAALINLSSWGLEPNGRDAHLLPFFNNKTQKTECQLIIDYKGLVDIVISSGEVKKIDAEIVCENDDFEYNMSEVVKHKIDFKKPRGEMYAAYVRVTMPKGVVRYEIMSKDEIEDTRKSSKAGDSGPWVSKYHEMCKKTVFRKSTKWLKLSKRARDVIEADDTQFDHIKVESPTAPKFDFDIEPEVVPSEETK